MQKRKLPPPKISLRPLENNGNNDHDRLLATLHHDHRHVVIMPLFKWILIDSETLSTLNFTNAFHEPSIRKVFLAEEFENSYADSGLDEQRELERIIAEAEAEQADTRLMEEEEVEEIEDEHHRHVVRGHAFNDYRDFALDVVRRRVPPQLIESFAEVGLVPKSTKNVVVHIPDGPEGEEHVEYIEPSLQLSQPLMEQARALQILEREVISWEVGEEIQLLKDNANANGNSFGSGNGMEEALDMVLLSEQQKGGGYAAKDSGNSHHTTYSNGNINKQVPPEDRVKASLKTVSRSLQRNTKILQTHDQLCELENHIAKKGNLRGLPGSTIAGLGLMGTATTDPKSAVIQKRMGVIEALQKVHVQLPVNHNSDTSNNSGGDAVTLASLYVTTPLTDSSDNNNGSGQQQLGSGSKGKQVHKSAVLAAQQRLNNPSHHGPPGSSAKRISETLRLLSETLDAQLLSSSGGASHIGNGHDANNVGHSNSMNSLGSHAHSKK